jgi:hypothetical protein
MRDTCAICGALIDPVPVEGTDPDDTDDEWHEVYECEQGHQGCLEVTEATEDNGWRRSERYTGALRQDDREVIV